MYLVNLLSLWFTGKITWQTVRYGLKKRPDAVAGKGGSYHVGLEDPNL